MSFEQPLPPVNANDPAATFLSASCLDFLLIELVPTAQRLARHPSLNVSKTPEDSTADDTADDGTGSVRTTGPVDDAELREASSRKLEAVGYRVGQGIAERFSKDHPRFLDTLDVIKFLCKDLWTLVFRKQIDNLKTNHRGVYVLTDNTFKPFSRISGQSLAETTARAQPFLWFPCGLIRGALASMGVNAVVHAESVDLPGAVFQIKTIAARP